MNNQLTQITFILDKSGSMAGLENDTVGGFNSMLDKQRKLDGNAFLSAVLFNQSSEYLYLNESIERIPYLTEKDYQPGGMTALYDAIGNTISDLDRTNHNYNELPKKNIVIIITDGYENASKEFNGWQIQKLVKQKQEEGWEFIFLGANIDAITAAENIGIKSNRAANFHNDAFGIQMNFDSVSKVISKFRSDAFIEENWKSEIEKDFVNRNKAD